MNEELNQVVEQLVGHLDSLKESLKDIVPSKELETLNETKALCEKFIKRQK